jgi:hypothetical protein
MKSVVVYWKGVCRRALKETAFLAWRKMILGLGVTLTGLLLQWAWGLHPWSDLVKIVLTVIVSYAIVTIGAYIWSALRVPAAMHSEQEAVIADLRETARLELERRSPKPSLTLVPGSRQKPTSLRMQWSQGGGVGRGPISVTPIHLILENDGQEAIKVIAFRLFRPTEPSIQPKRIEHSARVSVGKTTSVDVTWNLLCLLSGCSTDPDFFAVRGIHEIGMVLEYVRDSQRLQTDAEHVYGRLFSPGTQTLDITVSYERPTDGN